MSDLDDFKATYFDECSELLLDLEEQFAAIQSGDRSADRLNAVFRAIHSIKGGGGAFGFSELVAFAHDYETLLDHVRDGRVELSDTVSTLCIRSNDIVADFVNAAKSGASLGAGYGADERKQFNALTSGEQWASPAGAAHGRRRRVVPLVLTIVALAVFAISVWAWRNIRARNALLLGARSSARVPCQSDVISSRATTVP